VRDIAVYISSDDYRQKAAECEQIAARAHFARIAARYRDLARRWRDMAQQAERLERIADAYNVPIGADRHKTRPRVSPSESATNVAVGNAQMIDEQIALTADPASPIAAPTLTPAPGADAAPWKDGLVD